MIYDRLYSWQKRIVDSISDKQAYGLFLEMGLGKTPISLSLAEYHQCTKVIIITINSKALENEYTDGSFLWWCRQGMFKDYDFLTKKSKVDEVSSSRKQVLIINYEGLFKRSKSRTERIELKDILKQMIECAKNENVALIIDESHKLKTYQSSQTQACIKLQKYLSLYSNVYTYLLTGTPFTTGYIDLWTQLKVLGCKMTKSSFCDEFCIRGNLPGLLGWQQPIVGYKNIGQLYAIVHNYAITIKSEEVVDLPNSIFVEHSYKMTDEFRAFMSEKLSGIKLNKIAHKLDVSLPDSVDPDKISFQNNPFYRNIAYPNTSWFADTSGLCWLRARQLSIGFQGNGSNDRRFDKTRLDMLRKFLSENEDNYVLFYSYTSELFELYQICEELGYHIDVYCGEIKSLYFYDRYVSKSDEEKLVSSKNIILANWQSGSTGVNWQAYNKCIIFDLPVYKDYAQGLARIRRLGQKSNTVFYHVFTQNNWLDKGMKEALETQQDYTDKTFESDLARVQSLLQNEEED